MAIATAGYRLGRRRLLEVALAAAFIGTVGGCSHAAPLRIGMIPDAGATQVSIEQKAPLRAYLEKRIPRGSPGSAEDVGKLVAALFDSGIGFLSGETIYIDGAQGIAH